MTETKCTTIKDLKREYGKRVSFEKFGIGETMTIEMFSKDSRPQFLGSRKTIEAAEKLAIEYINFED